MKLSIIDIYRVYTDQEHCEPMVAAILTLANAIEQNGYQMKENLEDVAATITAEIASRN